MQYAHTAIRIDKYGVVTVHGIAGDGPSIIFITEDCYGLTEISVDTGDMTADWTITVAELRDYLSARARPTGRRTP
jgi:hypothetical protein